MAHPGTDLAHLLLSAFRAMTDEVSAELRAHGYAEIRPVHGLALRALIAGADNASELGRRMSVSKQAAAKTIAALEARNYVARQPDPKDGRRARLIVTDHGRAMLRVGEAIFDELRQTWEVKVGPRRLADVESTLRELVDPDSTSSEWPWGMVSALE